MAKARDLPSSDEEALPQIDPGQLIDEYQAGVWRYLRALGCDYAEADDLTQDTFLAVLRKPFVNYGPAATNGYLRKVAFNRFISARRKAGKLVLMEQEVRIMERKSTQLRVQVCGVR